MIVEQTQLYILVLGWFFGVLTMSIKKTKTTKAYFIADFMPSGKPRLKEII